MTRDPRHDPEQGDKVWWTGKSKARRRTVEYVTAMDTVIYSTGEALAPYREHACSLAAWRKWAKGDSSATMVSRRLTDWDETVTLTHQDQRELCKLRNELKAMGLSVSAMTDGDLIRNMMRFCFAKLYHHSIGERFERRQLKEFFS